MNKVFISALLLFYIFSLNIMAADSLSAGSRKSFRVDSISVTGNKTTKQEIILRELTFSPGDYITENDILFNRERIFSLSLFSNVTMDMLNEDGKNVLRIDVQESWYIWPVPFADVKDNTIKKLTYGLSVLYKNFRGMNETINATVALGYDPSFSLSYSSPWFIRKHDIYFSAGAGYSNIANKSAIAQYIYGSEFKQKYATGYLQLGKRFNLFHSGDVVVAWDYIETPAYFRNINASNERIDRVLRAGVNYFFDTRNLKQFPDSGFFAAAGFVHKGFGIKDINYSVLALDFRHYFGIWGDLTGKYRLASRSVLGTHVPLYDFSFLGNGEKIRGHYNDLKEGHHLYLGSLELKYPVIKEWDFSIKLPLIPRSLTSYRIAVFTTAFANTGATRFKGEKLTYRSFYSGYGAGLIFLILPYNIYRLEFALDEYKNGEVLLGFGFSF